MRYTQSSLMSHDVSLEKRSCVEDLRHSHKALRKAVESLLPKYNVESDCLWATQVGSTLWGLFVEDLISPRSQLRKDVSNPRFCSAI